MSRFFKKEFWLRLHHFLKRRKPEGEWHPHDYIMAEVVLPFIPRWMRPNQFTVARFVLTPIVIFLIVRGNYSWGIALFIIAAFTDVIDGSLARVRRQITNWGRLFDPVADKLLIGSLIVVVVWQYLDHFLAYTILTIELVFIFAAWIRKKHGGVPEANRWGKIKMFLQFLGVLFLLLSIQFEWPRFLAISEKTFYLAIIFAVLSLITHGI